MTAVLDGVEYRYRRALRKPVEVFRDFSWEVPAGRRTVLLGPNGAGKSTLMKLFAGQERPRRGAVRVGTSSTRHELAAAVGWMPQSIVAVRGMSVLQQVTYAGWLSGMSSRQSRQRANEAVEMVMLSEMADRPTRALSGGQLRRVGLAEALISSPPLLLLDEPTAGLDPQQRQQFRHILAALPVEQSVVVSTHQVDDLDRTFDHVTVMADSTILFDGSVSSFFALGSPDEDAESIFTQIIAGRRR